MQRGITKTNMKTKKDLQGKFTGQIKDVPCALEVEYDQIIGDYVASIFIYDRFYNSYKIEIKNKKVKLIQPEHERLSDDVFKAFEVLLTEKLNKQ